VLMPNKTISLPESYLYKSALLLSKINKSISVISLYEANKNTFIDISDFIDALNLLYVLNKIDIDFDTGIVKYA
jgi:hypothetical protein